MPSISSGNGSETLPVEDIVGSIAGALFILVLGLTIVIVVLYLVRQMKVKRHNDYAATGIIAESDSIALGKTPLCVFCTQARNSTKYC